MNNFTSENSNSSSSETPGSTGGEPEKASPESASEEVYEYCDKSGDLRYEKVHKQADSGSEDIFLRHPERGPGMHGESYLPYRVADFPNPATGDSPLMTYHESENTADIVRDLGLPATTTPLGPEMNVPHEVVPYFDNLQVVIFPDNDEEGRFHTGRLGDALLEVATCVKVVQLDGRKQGEDAADWIEQKRSEGLSDEEIKREVESRIGEAPVCHLEDFQSGEFGLDGPFWHVTDGGKVNIAQKDLIDFLTGRGFRKLYAGTDESALVQVEDNVVSLTSGERIKDHVVTYLKDEVPGERGVAEALMRGSNYYFSGSLFEFLPVLKQDFHRASPRKGYRYYQNGFVEITPWGYALCPYSELDGLVWEEQIIDRPFHDLSSVEDRTSWEWRCFLNNVMGGHDGRLRSLRTALGYLQHPYKDQALTKAIIFMDEVDSGLEDGRTGKSLVAKSLQHVCSTHREDGRNFSFGTRFAFQEVDLGTEVVDFNDVREDFPFGNLFSAITDALSVERKGQDKFTLSFEDSPKFLISTNHVIEGGGASFDDRTFEVEFSDHYGPDHCPQDDFGHRLLEEWDEKEWARFDNTMVACIQEFLRDGLVEYERQNVEHRRLKQNTCASFAMWAADSVEQGVEYAKDALYESFRDEHAPDFNGLKRSQFWTWMGYYASIQGLELDTSRPSRDGERVRCITFVPNG
ncbi:hypothetical protein GGP78_000409 [Salinibacter ruber]|uniref:hypothetical protein n=1 Tax=Salinibacter ruber TaxID=146919 RepID=UPI0021674683|nr:hypothetical protein [Salinibacter ruber]MCS3853759.1 hypothetical protein [Salinibacter ruber]